MHIVYILWLYYWNNEYFNVHTHTHTYIYIYILYLFIFLRRGICGKNFLVIKCCRFRIIPLMQFATNCLFNTYFLTLSFDYCRLCWVLSLPLHWKSLTSMKELDAEAPMWSPETNPTLHIRGQNHFPHSSDPFFICAFHSASQRMCQLFILLLFYHFSPLLSSPLLSSPLLSSPLLSSPRFLDFLLHLSLQGPLYGFLFFCTCINSCKPLKNPKGAKRFLYVQANAPLMCLIQWEWG